MTDNTGELDFSPHQKVFAGIAVTCGIVVAACISGIPAITCTALAQTYGQAVSDFGLLALISVTLFSLFFEPPTTKIRQRLYYIAAAIFSLYVGWQFVGAILAGRQNLNLSLAQCYLGTKEPTDAKSHVPIPIENSFSIWEHLL